VHRFGLAWEVGVGQHGREQRMPEPGHVALKHQDPAIDGFAERTGRVVTELARDGDEGV
jgi:hypothetical protein